MVQGQGEGRLLDEGGVWALARAQLFFAALRLGNFGGQAENILGLTRRIAQKGEFHARPNQASIPQEVALVDVEVIDLAGDQLLERIPVLLQVIRMGEPVKHAGKTEFLCRAAKHATVSGVDAWFGR